MIKKLRRKFIIVIMSVVTALLSAAFIALLISTNTSLVQQMGFDLRAALNSPVGMPVPGNVPDNRRKASLTVLTDADGTVITINNNIYGLSDADAITVTRLALGTGADTGFLREYNLRYLIERSGTGPVHLAFLDNTMQKIVFDKLLLNAAIVGVPMLALFFAISLLLARWVVRPVEKAWNSQRQFIADASHELKTPLTVILSNVEMLTGDSGIEEAKTKTRIENIFEEAKCMKVLVDDMLSLARTDLVRSKVALERVDFSTVLNTSVLIFEPILFDAGKRFTYTIKDNLSVMGDGAKLRQLTQILLDNAYKYSPSAGLISVSLDSGNKNELCLEVTNECENIPKEELSRIFERFYRLDKSRTSSGSGLGLAIAENIIREHGGRIWAKSEDRCVTFCITLPTAR